MSGHPLHSKFCSYTALLSSVENTVEVQHKENLISFNFDHTYFRWQVVYSHLDILSMLPTVAYTRVGTLIVATIYLQLIQNRCMFRSFTVLQCSHQHCVQPVASYVEVVGYL